MSLPSLYASKDDQETVRDFLAGRSSFKGMYEQGFLSS